MPTLLQAFHPAIKHFLLLSVAAHCPGALVPLTDPTRRTSHEFGAAQLCLNAAHLAPLVLFWLRFDLLIGFVRAVI